MGLEEEKHRRHAGTLLTRVVPSKLPHPALCASRCVRALKLAVKSGKEAYGRDSLKLAEVRLERGLSTR